MADARALMPPRSLDRGTVNNPERTGDHVRAGTRSY